MNSSGMSAACRASHCRQRRQSAHSASKITASRFISAEAVDEKDAAVLVQGLRDPDGQRYANQEVAEISPDDRCHISFLRVVCCGCACGEGHFRNLIAQGMTVLCSERDNFVIT